MSDADCTSGREPRSIAASIYLYIDVINDMMEDVLIVKEKLMNFVKTGVLYNKYNLLYKSKVKCAKTWESVAN